MLYSPVIDYHTEVKWLPFCVYSVRYSPLHIINSWYHYIIPSIWTSSYLNSFSRNGTINSQQTKFKQIIYNPIHYIKST